MHVERPFQNDDVKSLPRFNQTQRALQDQLTDLMDVANRIGMYDAADYLRGRLDDGR